MDSDLHQKSFFVLIFIALVILVFLIVRPFLTALLTGIVFAYTFYPVYVRLNKKIKRKNISALITSLLVVLIITMPLFFVLNTLSKETYASYILTRQKITTGQSLASECDVDKASCKLLNYFSDKFSDPRTRYYFDTTAEGITTRVTDGISNFLLSIPIFVLHLFITLFILFFLFRDGKLLVDKIEKIIPLKYEHRRKVFEKLKEMTYAVIYGSLIIAFIQGTLGGIGFFIFGIPTPFIWGIVMMFASLIPYVGSSIVWFPASLFLIFNGYVDLDGSLVMKGILLAFYGIFIVGTIDNILKPKIIGERGGLHPVLVLLGVVGGLQLFGFIGVVIGPILVAMMVTFIDIYEYEKKYTS